MTTHFRSMTEKDLRNRADSVVELDCVADYIGGDDLRTVTLFFEHQDMRWTSQGGFPGPDSSAEIIGAVLSDDDEVEPTTVLDREGVRDLFGDAWVWDREEIATEALWA